MTSPNFPPKRISQLPVATGVALDSVVVGVVDGTTYQVPVEVLPFTTATNATFTTPVTVPDGTPGSIPGLRFTTNQTGFSYNSNPRLGGALTNLVGVNIDVNGHPGFWFGRPNNGVGSGFIICPQNGDDTGAQPFVLRGAYANTTGGNGGQVLVQGGFAIEGNGGAVNITANAGNTSSATPRDGGSVAIQPGAAASGGTNGTVVLRDSGSVPRVAVDVGTIALTGTVAVTGTLSVSSTASVSGAVSLASSLAVAGTATFSGPVNLATSLTVAATASVAGAVQMSTTVVAGSASIATTATTGFLYFPSATGTPTGTPNSPYTGAVPITYDRGNQRLYIYSGTAWLQVALATTP